MRVKHIPAGTMPSAGRIVEERKSTQGDAIEMKKKLVDELPCDVMLYEKRNFELDEVADITFSHAMRKGICKPSMQGIVFRHHDAVVVFNCSSL